MVEHRGGARLDPEPLDELGVLGELRLEHLDRDAAAQPAVDGLPHLAHAAGGDQPLQAVPARQRHTNSRAHGPPCSAASITARPIGAASAPPVADNAVSAVSLRAPQRRPSEPARAQTRCTTRAVVCGAGRCRALRYQSWMRSARRGSPLSAVSTFSAPTISSVSLAATCGDTARRCWCGAVVLMLARSGPLQAVDQVGLHGDAAIGDGSRNHRVLQRRQRDILLADARHPQRRSVRNRADGRFGDLQRNRARGRRPGRTTAPCCAVRRCR